MDKLLNNKKNDHTSLKKHTSFLLIILLAISSIASGQTQKDTIYAIKTTVPVIVDGSASDACWAQAQWKPIDQVWIPYAAKMAAGDFEGKYKVAWDSLYLYVLVEVVDDMLSDDHAIPTQNWWNDDCLEVMIDEDRSKGNHQFNNNAFAYHISLSYDAIDLDASGNGINYRNNLKVVMDTIGTNTYLWEFAIKIYDAGFKSNDPEASRVKLFQNKLMGFTIAYCDNDQTLARENFIGSMYMTSKTANDNYITADYFGSLILADKQGTTYSEPEKNNAESILEIFPNPAANQLRLKRKMNFNDPLSVEIRSISGEILKTCTLTNQDHTIEIENLAPGMYLLTVSFGKTFQTLKFIRE